MLNLRLARWRLLLGTSLLATGMNVGAQDAGNRDPMRLAPIRVQDLGINYRSDAAAGTLRSTTPLKDWPQSVQTLNNELLRDQGIYRFDDIYRNITGATQFSNLQDLSIRGFRTQRGQVSFNGMRANPYDGFINPIMANIDRVEVLKGPAALLYGNGSPGGTINMITKKPLARERHEVTGLIAEDQRYRTTFDSTGPVGEDGDLLYRFIGSVDDAESYRNNVEERSWQLAPSLTWLPTDTTTVSLETEVFRVFNKGKRGRGIPAPNGDTGAVPLSFAANEPTDRQVNEGYAAQLTLDQALTRDWDFRLTGRFSESDYDDRYHEPISLRDDKRTMDRQWRDLNYVNDEWNAIAELRGAERLGRFRHELNLGVDLGRKLRRDNFAFVDDPDIEPIDIYDPVYGATNPSEYDYSLDQRTFDTRNRSVYVRDLVSVGRWKFLGGLRYDHFKEQSVRAEGSNDALTGQAGIVYSLTPKHSLYGSYSQGFEPQIPPVDHDGDDGLFEPVESEQFEAGVKSDWFRGRLSTTAAVYQIVRKNQIGDDPPRQIGEIESQGLELDVTGRLTDNWKVQAGYAYTDAEVTRDADPANVGKEQPNTPHHAAQLWTRYDVPSLAVGFGGGLYYVSERSTFDDRVTLPSYTIADFAVYYYGIDDLELALNISNVTDERHFVGGYDEGIIFPGDPRTVSLSASYRF